MQRVPTLLPQRASFPFLLVLLLSHRCRVTGGGGEAPYKAQSRRGAQASCHPGLAGLRRPKRGDPSAWDW